jgi:sporulation protein YabP
MTDEKKLMHNLILENKHNLTITCVTYVDCFDDRIVRLFTQMGELTIQGKDLHVNSVNVETGDVAIEGDITAIIYGNAQSSSPVSFFGRLFK